MDSLDDDALDKLADLLSDRLATRLGTLSVADGWLTSTDAAEHLALSLDALDKLCAERSIPFAQDGPGCKRYFRRSELDAWRERGGASVHPLPVRGRRLAA